MKEETMQIIDDELDALAQALQNRERWQSPEQRCLVQHRMIITCARAVVDVLTLLTENSSNETD